MKKRREKILKKSQVTIFIIIAIFLLIIMLFFFFAGKKISNFFTEPDQYYIIENCINQKLKEGISKIENQGGVLEPTNFIMHQGMKIDYSCYTTEYYKKCVMQKPFIKQTMENELKKYMQKEIENCLSDSKEILISKGYDVSYTKPNVEVKINPNNVKISANSKLSFVKGESLKTYNNIVTSISSSLYEFADIYSSINNFETKYGDSETTYYMMKKPHIKVEKKTKSEGSKIYIITNRDTQEHFNFATRSMALPPGVLGL